MNNEDMSDVIKNLSNMLNKDGMPENVKSMLNNFTSNMNEKEKKDDISSSDSSSSGFDIDIGMIMKMKSIMDSMKNQKDDPRANLLLSLKPYLKESRKDKVDQYIKLFSMSKVLEVLNPLGGDNKHDL